MNSHIIAANSPVALIGCGYMGKTYLQILLDSGFAPADIIVADRDEAARQWCTTHHPSIAVVDSVDAALAHQPRTLLNITNSPEHGWVMRRALDAGVLNHFVEKPLVLPPDLRLLNDVPERSKVCVGYLINFSPTMGALFTAMSEKSLVVCEGRGFWGKDRTADSRPTAGDWEDEATHPLAALLKAVAVNQLIVSVKISAALSRLPFANSEAQARGRQWGHDSPPRPTSTSHVAITVDVLGSRAILLTVHSSFAAFAQERRIDFTLAPCGSDELSHQARVEFDVNGKDMLHLREIRSKKPAESWEFPGRNKLTDQLYAFLRYAAGEKKDIRLVDLHEGIRLVKASSSAILSSNIGAEQEVF